MKVIREKNFLSKQILFVLGYLLLDSFYVFFSVV